MVWVLWALSAAAAVQLAPNPLYVAVVVAVAALVSAGPARDGPLRRAFPVVMAVGSAFGLVRVVLVALTAHGTGPAMFTLPQVGLPTLLGGFTVGGPVESQVVARAAAEAWALVGILAVFAAFNSVVSHHELVQWAPRAFYELGLSVVVAIAFVPSTVAAVGAVRQADAARTGGRVVRRGRLLRQAVPILETGLERAVGLAESMDSRGFGRRAQGRAGVASAWLGLSSLVALTACFVALVARNQALAWAMFATGAGAMAAAVAVASRAERLSRYRRRRVGPAGWALAAVSGLTPAVVAALAAAGDPTLVWPADRLTAPGLRPAVVLALSLLAVPALAVPALAGGWRRAGAAAAGTGPSPAATP